MAKRWKQDEPIDLTGGLWLRLARTAYLWFASYFMTQLLVIMALSGLAIWLEVPDAYVLPVLPLVPLAFAVQLWGVEAERRGSTITVRNGTFARRRSFSTEDVRIDTTTKILFGLSDGGRMPVPFVVLVDATTGHRTKILASGLPTKKQRRRFWNLLVPRLEKQPGAYFWYHRDF